MARSSLASPLPVERVSSAQARGPSDIEPLEASAEKRKVMCFWLSFGRQRYMCGDESLDEVKKKCNQVASAEVGEPVECSCTDDPEYIRDSCD
ncbi:MAG TPA: hypothetical protein VN764_13260 [Polyangiaceae bacterium]|nr:hypothetical protein [Polyangiaceae bacterium]